MMFADDDALIAHGEAFIARTLPKARWTHEGHIAAALYLVARRLDVSPERDMPDMIRRYNDATGVANTEDSGYHETITQAHLITIRARLDARPKDEALVTSLAALLDGGLGDKNWLMAHYTREVLFSRHARAHWVEPDVKALV